MIIFNCAKLDSDVDYIASTIHIDKINGINGTLNSRY